MARLIAIDRPGGDEFVRELLTIWEAGDAAFPVDQRLPRAAKSALMERLGVGDDVEPGDALVVATSGSTGDPKGVVLTHDAIAASADATSRRLGVRDDDHWLACLPLSHVGGLSVVTRALHRSVPVTVLPGFDAGAVADAAVSGGATLVSLVATALRRIDPAAFRTIVLGGSHPPTDRPTNSVTTYGMTETGSGVVYDGLPLDGVEVEVVDGEIHVRGPMLLRCYRDGTDPKDAAGWLATGDLGGWSDDGCLRVDGRRGELIISGGENVWPETVERVLGDHPGIADVLVRGRDDPEWGQLVEAVLVPVDRGNPPGLEVLRAHVKLTLPAFMAPRAVVYADAIPRTALGKIVRSRSVVAGQASSRSADPATPAPPSMT